MEIRPFLELDQDAVIGLWQRCDLLRPWNDPRKDIARKLQVQRDLFLVGVIDGAIVAAAMAGYDGHRGWVNYLAVEPDQRRRKLGLQMMAEIERRLRARGCPKINVQIRRDNLDVVRFYESLGFNEDAAVSMGKRLESDAPAGGQ